MLYIHVYNYTNIYIRDYLMFYKFSLPTDPIEGVHRRVKN